jgi:hypothetical protein
MPDPDPDFDFADGDLADSDPDVVKGMARLATLRASESEIPEFLGATSQGRAR